MCRIADPVAAPLGAADLHRALVRGEFALAYQPQVALATGRLAGAEALLRWRHPARGVLPPAAFLPLAAATGVLALLDARALAEACRRARAWGLPVAVNATPCALADPAFALAVADTLATTGCPPGRLVLEIGAGAPLALAARATLRALRALGVGLALADVGLGHANRRALADLPLTQLKLARALVADVATDPRAAAAVAAALGLARALGLAAVAEGVERPGQRDALRALGCPLGQGYLLGRPGPPACIEAHLANHGARDAARALEGAPPG